MKILNESTQTFFYDQLPLLVHYDIRCFVAPWVGHHPRSVKWDETRNGLRNHHTNYVPPIYVTSSIIALDAPPYGSATRANLPRMAPGDC